MILPKPMFPQLQVLILSILIARVAFCLSVHCREPPPEETPQASNCHRILPRMPSFDFLDPNDLIGAQTRVNPSTPFLFPAQYSGMNPAASIRTSGTLRNFSKRQMPDSRWSQSRRSALTARNRMKAIAANVVTRCPVLEMVSEVVNMASCVL